MTTVFQMKHFITRFKQWFTTPTSSALIDKRNFTNVQIDAIGVALGSAASPFLSVFLTRLEATSLQISLITVMPAITGMLLAIPLGRFLHKQRKIVPWFSLARLVVITCYTLTGLIAFFVPRQALVPAILVIWAFATIPQTIVSISFSVVMNAVAGPQGRYELMSRRWSLLGLTTALTAFMIGQVLVAIDFPINYQVVFMFVSFGGLISYYYSSHISIPDHIVEQEKASITSHFRSLIKLVTVEKAYLAFVGRRFVFLSGVSLIAPLIPIYYVREIQATDNWIAAINTTQTFVMIFGYSFWSRQSRLYGSRRALLFTTLGVGIYPIMLALTHAPWLIVIIGGIAGFFQAGLDLVFFDELLKTFPEEYSAVFVSTALSIQYLSAILSPMIGSWLAVTIGVAPAIMVGGAIRLFGFILFATSRWYKKQVQT